MTSLSTDLVIIGSGIAGLCAAINAEKLCVKVILINKGTTFATGSSFLNYNSRWGITFARVDSERKILFDRINDLSKGTNNKRLSEIVVDESYEAFLDLNKWGASFLKSEDNTLQRYQPCFLSFPLAAIITSTKDFADSLAQKIICPAIRVLDKHRVVQIISENGCCAGCIAEDESGKRITVTAKACILATGGNAAQFTPNIVDSNLLGDGYAMLRELGISLKNMTYMQRVWEDYRLGPNRFSFTQLIDPALCFEDYNGKVIPIQEFQEDIKLERKSHVPISNLQQDSVFDNLLLDYIPVLNKKYAIQVKDKHGTCLFRILPHYQASNGGVEIGPNGETSLPGLYAAGEVTTGMHGGDRVGGMMITSAIVFGKRAAIHACNSYIK